MEKKYELIKFEDGDFNLDVNVSPDEETVWLTQDQIANLYQKSRSTITEHINNIFSEGELENMTSVGISDISNHRPARLYNLEVILAVGYRVKSQRGILFRRWATTVLKQYLFYWFIYKRCWKEKIHYDKNHYNKYRQYTKESIKIKSLIFSYKKSPIYCTIWSNFWGQFHSIWSR